jgi:hypothetical protein
MRKSGSILLSALAFSSVLSLAGWAALSLAHRNDNWISLGYLGGFLEMPGGFFAALLAMLFSPQGVHGIDDFEWAVLPFDLLFYFLAFYAFSLLRRRDTSTK